MARNFAVKALAAILFSQEVFADGRGLIGWGITMYNPTCAFACRGVISKCTLLCTPTDGGANHGTHHNPVATPPDCFVSDPAFLRTMALCIDTYCPTSDKPSILQIQDYWYGHLGTGTIGNTKYVPVISYTEALRDAKEDQRTGVHFAGTNHTGGHHKLRRQEEELNTLPTIKSKQPLNVTSLIAASDWQLQFNGMLTFEANEKGHSTYTVVLMLIAIFLPVFISLIRFVPGIARSKSWSYLNSVLIHPALWGSNHREPVAMAAGGGLVPTRGQAMYIALISILNIVFLAADYLRVFPQSIFGSWPEQSMSVIGCRAGGLAMGNMVAMFVFSSRNNLLLYITDWSHGTFLLLHRWLGYWTIIQTVLHSILLLAYYNKYGDYASELVRLYWIWGIVATVAAVAILPFSLLIVRQKAYSLFYASHLLLVALFIVGYYYHIWYIYFYNWGYEIYAFIGVAIWSKDLIIRGLRILYHGWRTAKVTTIDGSNGEYLRIDIDGTSADGVVYLCFPTLGLHFWQFHPFSVMSSFSRQDLTTLQAESSSPILPDSEKHAAESEIVAVNQNKADTASTSSSSPSPSHHATPRVTLIARVRGGITARLNARLLSAAANTGLRLPVLIEGPYNTTVHSQLSHCTSVVGIAGGVGITGVLPLVHFFGSPRHGRLYWGMRDESLKYGVASELADLPRTIQVETTVGKRLDVESILREELAGRPGDEGLGLVGIVVCGPAGLADEVRKQVTGLTKRGVTRTPYILVDEAFSW